MPVAGTSRPRLSEEGRRELDELAKRLGASTSSLGRLTVVAPATPAKPVTRRVSTRKPAEPSLTDYIRKNYEDDQVLQMFADVIDKNTAMWIAMGQFFNLDISTGDGLVSWDVNRRMAVRDALTTTVTLEIVDKKGTASARR